MMHLDRFDAALARCPLVAILRGLRPDEVEAIGDALVTAGFAIIEVPLNSPDPFDSIARLTRRLGGDLVVGAGTVLRADDVARVAEAGGAVVISPNMNPGVIAASVAAGLVSLPGISTPTEAFAALEAGAAAIKLFPAEGSSPAILKAMRAVLPPGTRVLPVGGVTPELMQPWREAGAAGFGLGSALYKPGMGAAEVGARARAFVAALGQKIPQASSSPAKGRWRAEGVTEGEDRSDVDRAGTLPLHRRATLGGPPPPCGRGT